MINERRGINPVKISDKLFIHLVQLISINIGDNRNYVCFCCPSFLLKVYKQEIEIKMLNFNDKKKKCKYKSNFSLCFSFHSWKCPYSLEEFDFSMCGFGLNSFGINKNW